MAQAMYHPISIQLGRATTPNEFITLPTGEEFSTNAPFPLLVNETLWIDETLVKQK